jgi:hypothetical protein
MLPVAAFALAFVLAEAPVEASGHSRCEQLVLQIRQDMQAIDRLLAASGAANSPSTRQALDAAAELQRRVIDHMEELARLRQSGGDGAG